MSHDVLFRVRIGPGGTLIRKRQGYSWYLSGGFGSSYGVEPHKVHSGSIFGLF